MKNFKGKYVNDQAPGGAVSALLDNGVGDNAAYNKLLADYTELRAQFVALLAKLDVDSGVTNTDYAADLTPVAATAVAGSTVAVRDLLFPKPQGI